MLPGGHTLARWTRRLSLAALGAALATIAPAAPSPAVNLEREPALYLVGSAHLDTQWRWSYPLTISQLIPGTVQANLPLFAKYPNYIFNFSGANRYRMLQEYYPEMFEAVRQQVAAGRWFPCGSSWEENDVNVPSCESVTRQILLGQRFFLRHFKTESCEYMLPDCFGFPASLPSVLAHCGLRGFSTQKLTWHCAAGIPFNIGLWEGLDGQSIIAAFNPGNYGARINGNLAASDQVLRFLEAEAKVNGLKACYFYYGTGDTGGAPDEESVATAHFNATAPGKVRVFSSKADQLFRDITESQKARFPRYQGDLLLTEHSAGSITSQSAMKRWNRQNELLADAAERAAVIAHLLGAAPYPRQKLSQAWGLVLGGQFHDILPGTSHPQAYCYSWNDEIIALNSFAEVLQNSVGAASRALDTRIEGTPLVVFNPLAFAREDVVEATLDTPPPAGGLQVFTPEGKPCPTQVIPNPNGTARLLFTAQVPALGLSVFALKPATPTHSASELSVTERSLENARYRIALNDQGDIAELFDKQLQRQLLTAPIRLAFLHEQPAEWPAWNMDWTDRQKPPVGHVEGPAQFRIVEQGPVRVALEIRRQTRGSTFCQTLRLAAGSPGDRVEFAHHIVWQTAASSLKAVFPLTLTNELATYNWEIGKIQRKSNDPQKFEVPTRQWIDLTDTNAQAGVTLLTGAKYGSDKPSNHELRLTLLFTPGVTDRFVEQGTQDWGVHDFVFGLSSHRGGWQQGKADEQALRLEQPLLAFRASPHAGTLGRAFSLFRPGSAQVALRAVKLAEDNEDIIIRLQELAGAPQTNVSLQPLVAIKAATEVNGIEKTLRPLTNNARDLALDFAPYQLRSVALKLEAPAPLGAPVSLPVDLPFNTNAFTSNKVAGPVTPPREPTIPAEMIGNTVVTEGITFRIGPRRAGALNAVACQGQTLSLPPSKASRLYLLAMSMNGDVDADFVLDGQTSRVRVQEGSGFIGQWDNRVFEGVVPPVAMSIPNPLQQIVPGFIKRAPLAWYCSHRHGLNFEDRPYEYSYLFKIAFEGAPKTVVLPRQPALRILAVTLAEDPNLITPLTPLYDDFTGRPALQLGKK